jgi:hypothetical protein
MRSELVQTNTCIGGYGKRQWYTRSPSVHHSTVQYAPLAGPLPPVLQYAALYKDKVYMDARHSSTDLGTRAPRTTRPELTVVRQKADDMSVDIQSNTVL